MRIHHSYRHFADRICVPVVNNRRKDLGLWIKMHLKCDRCGLQVQSRLLHHQSLNCLEGHEQKKQQEVAIRSVNSLQHKFTAYDEELERVDFL